MTLLERIHGAYVHNRRVEALARQIGELLPMHARVLDVGCGDGRLARRIQERRSDISIRGIDVLVRPEAHIPVSAFDGARIPEADESVDVVMFVDVLHHTADPMVLLREATRVAAQGIVIKDHLCEGAFAAPILRFMDRVGNRRHGVAVPYNYWRQQQWDCALTQLGVTPEVWKTRLGLYPFPANLAFERSLHFLTLLRPVKKSQYECALHTDKALV